MRQVLLGLPQQISQLAVVDTFGLGIAADGLHLTTWSQYDLGRRLANTALATGIVGGGGDQGSAAMSPWISIGDYLPSLLSDLPQEFQGKTEEKLQSW